MFSIVGKILQEHVNNIIFIKLLLFLNVWISLLSLKGFLENVIHFIRHKNPGFSSWGCKCFCRYRVFRHTCCSGWSFPWFFYSQSTERCLAFGWNFYLLLFLTVRPQEQVHEIFIRMSSETMPPLKIEGNQGGLQKDLVIFETCSSCLFRGFGGMLPQLHLLPSTCAAVPDYPIRLSLSLCESSLSRFNLWNLSLLLCWNVSRNTECMFVCS